MELFGYALSIFSVVVGGVVLVASVVSMGSRHK